MGLLDGGLKATIANAFSAFFLPATVHQMALTDDGMGGMTETETGTYTTKGMVESYSDYIRAQLQIPQTDVKLIVLQSGVDITLTTRDQVTVRDVRWSIVAISEDPAQAAWTLQARPLS